MTSNLIGFDALDLARRIEERHDVKVAEMRVTWAPDDGSDTATVHVDALAESPTLGSVVCTIGFAP